MNNKPFDALAFLLENQEDAEKAAARNEKRALVEIWAHLAIDTLKAKVASWKAREYKTCDKTISYEDINEETTRSYTITEINSRRRANTISNLKMQISRLEEFKAAAENASEQILDSMIVDLEKFYAEDKPLAM